MGLVGMLGEGTPDLVIGLLLSLSEGQVETWGCINLRIEMMVTFLSADKA